MKISSHEFGEILERDIAKLLDLSMLKDYIMHNVVLYHNGLWCQLDHLIILPNKLIIVEDKTRRCKKYIIHKDIDYYIYKVNKIEFNNSVVKQLDRSKKILNNIVKAGVNDKTFDTIDINNVSIEGVICIRNNGNIETTQVDYPVYNDSDFIYFIKAIEMFIKNIDIKEHTSNIVTLEAYINHYKKSSEEYIKALKLSGSYNDSQLNIDIDMGFDFIASHGIDTNLGNFGIKSNKLSNDCTENQVNRYNQAKILFKERCNVSIPNGFKKYVEKYYYVSVESIVEHFCALELVKRKYLWIYSFIQPLSHLIDAKHIVDICKINNRDYVDFILYCISIFEKEKPDKFQRLINGVQYSTCSRNHINMKQTMLNFLLEDVN